MLNPTKRWQEFEAAYRREAHRDLSFRAALSIFEALWAHAELLRPGFAAASRYDLEADFRVARALNGLPPASRLVDKHRPQVKTTEHPVENGSLHGRCAGGPTA